MTGPPTRSDGDPDARRCPAPVGTPCWAGCGVGNWRRPASSRTLTSGSMTRRSRRWRRMRYSGGWSWRGPRAAGGQLKPRQVARKWCHLVTAWRHRPNGLLLASVWRHAPPVRRIACDSAGRVVSRGVPASSSRTGRQSPCGNSRNHDPTRPRLRRGRGHLQRQGQRRLHDRRRSLPSLDRTLRPSPTGPLGSWQN
jgi:hypothetical protein